MGKASARDFRIWIFDWCHDAFDSCFDQRIGTRSCAALMSVRLEGNVSSRAARLVAGLLKCERLSMLHFLKKVEAFTNDLLIRIHDDSTDKRAGTDLADA